MKHHLGHWLTVVILKAFFFVFFGSIALYLLALGFWLALPATSHFLPENSGVVTTELPSKLPFFQKATELILLQGQAWPKGLDVWLAFVIGLPMFIIGLNVLTISLFNFFNVVVDLRHNRTQCPFCKTFI